MLLAEVTTVISVDLKTTSCEGIYDTNPSLADNCSQVGFERHSVALLLLGLLTFVMGSGAAFGRSRPAAVALIAIGVVVLGLALALRPAGERRHRRDRPGLRRGARLGGDRAVVRGCWRAWRY